MMPRKSLDGCGAKGSRDGRLGKVALLVDFNRREVEGCCTEGFASSKILAEVFEILKILRFQKPWPSAE